MAKTDPIAPSSIEPLADCALLIRWPQHLDERTTRMVQNLAESLRQSPLPDLVEVVPSYASLALFFDAQTRSRPDLPALQDAIKQRLGALEMQPAVLSRRLTIPVSYGGEEGPDLDELARVLGLHPDEVIARHCTPEYRVAMLGFQPGFAYLLGLDPKLALARRSTPRLRVPAGSVAIGGVQTGIYPRESPGGWHLVGRTAVVLFDASAQPPTLFAPFDRVRFRRVRAPDLAQSSVQIE